jgi:hypothetical protein
VSEPLIGGCADDVASSGLCGDGDVEFVCGRVFIGGGSSCGDGLSRRPPPPAFASRCAVCGTGFRTRPWAVSLVAGRIVLRALVVASADDVLEYCLARSGVSGVGCVVSRLAEFKSGRQVVVLR